MTTLTQYTTWADHHPEVAANFARKPLAWPCDQITTDLSYCHQPTIVKSPDGALITHGTFPYGTDALLWHSTDGGRAWRQLARTPLLEPPLPPQMEHTILGSNGVGVTREGTLLIACRQICAANPITDIFRDPTLLDRSWIIRSEDGGRTWRQTGLLDTAPYENGGGAVARIHQMRDGRLLYPLNVRPGARPGKPVPLSEMRERALVYESADDGATWRSIASLGEDTDESDLLELPSGRILCATRLQRKKLPQDPPSLICPEFLDEEGRVHLERHGDTDPYEVANHSIIKNTCVLHSDDGGVTWSEPRLVTGWVQQTAGLVRLRDGTIVMPYGHKDEGHGQRFVLSYDEGETWSNARFELNKFGMYAHSVVLDDDTIVTVTETPRWHKPVRLHVLRWRVPPREVVEEGGCFRPRPVAFPSN
jgi:hypothetical protein